VSGKASGKESRKEPSKASKSEKNKSGKGSRNENGNGSGGEATAKVARDEAHYVYRRNGLPCFVCGTKILRQEMEGRNLFWCPECQGCQEGPS
jgi:formamidopyrimidine-DNA glycosylase